MFVEAPLALSTRRLSRLTQPSAGAVHSSSPVAAPSASMQRAASANGCLNPVGGATSSVTPPRSFLSRVLCCSTSRWTDDTPSTIAPWVTSQPGTPPAGPLPPGASERAQALPSASSGADESPFLEESGRLPVRSSRVDAWVFSSLSTRSEVSATPKRGGGWQERGDSPGEGSGLRGQVENLLPESWERPSQWS